MKQLYLSKNKIFGGVCGGIAEYISVEIFIVRFIYVILAMSMPPMIAVYLLMWLITPEKDNINI